MLVNLFDDCFRHEVCSVAGKTPKHIQYVRDQQVFEGVTLFTDGYVNSGVARTVESRVKIGWLHEPECLHPMNYENNPTEDFDFILSYQARGSNGKYRYAPYGGVWIDESQWGIFHPKTKLVSLLSGDKLATSGHRIRREIADWAADGGDIMIDLYGYRGLPVNYGAATKVLTLKDYHFSIVTETCKQDGLFTEWLLDCFVMGTIPVFWGCPDIAHFFNDDGVLSFDTLADVQAIIPELSPALYESKRAAIAENAYLAVLEYAITEDWIYNHILKEYE